jgi:hypothetical protein
MGDVMERSRRGSEKEGEEKEGEEEEEESGRHYCDWMSLARDTC